MTPADFPILCKYIQKTKRPQLRHGYLETGITLLSEGKQNGQIYNVYYQDAKTKLNYALEDAWKAFRDEYAFWLSDGKTYSLPDDLREFVTWQMGELTLHLAPSVAKKLKATKLKHAAIDEARKFVAEVMPLSDLFKELKTKVIKGRVPSGKPAAPVNPNKIIKTCGCCFRQQAISKDETMVHHGYQRPGHGSQTESCPGVRFKSLDVSDDGYNYMQKLFASDLKEADDILKRTGQILAVPSTRYNSTSRRYDSKMVHKGEPEFDRYLRIYISNIESNKRHAEHNIKSYKRAFDDFRAKQKKDQK